MASTQKDQHVCQLPNHFSFSFFKLYAFDCCFFFFEVAHFNTSAVYILCADACSNVGISMLPQVSYTRDRHNEPTSFM